MPKPISEEERTEWKGRIQKQRQSGLSIKRWCGEHGIRLAAFYYWKQKLFEQPLALGSFTEIRFKRQAGSILLQGRGLSIRIGSDCDLDLRKKLFALLAEGL